MAAIDYDYEAIEAVKPRRYVRWIFGMTLVYLLFELAFNARLLDVTGGQATKDQIHVVEVCGRLISGIAVTLGLWGTWLMPKAEREDWAVRRRVKVMGIWAMICMTVVYVGQKALVDSIVANSDGTERRIAYQLRSVSSAALSGKLVIDGLDVPQDELQSPQGKSFLALLPFLAFSTRNLPMRVENVMREVVEAQIEAKVGTPTQAYNRLFVESAHQISDLYNAYVKTSNSYGDALKETQKRADQAWADFKADLNRSLGVTPDKVKRNQRAQVAARLIDKGIPVSKNWNPSDRNGFNSAIVKKVKAEADAAYAAAQNKLLPGAEPLPKGMAWEQFYQHDSVQQAWRQMMGLESRIRIEPDMTPERFTEAIYTPMTKDMIQAEMTRLRADDADFQDGGKLEEIGRDAMMALVVPPIALTFSLIGAMVHLFKVANYSILLARPRFEHRMPVILGAAMTLTILGFMVPNNVTYSRVYQNLEMQTDITFTPFAAYAVRWVVQSQPFFYPLNETIRTVVLRGISFGYQAED